MDGAPTPHGHLTELPSGAQEHIDQLHPDLQRAMGERLLQLSHLDFYDLERGKDHYPNPSEHYSPTRVEIGEQHQPQVDRVGTYLETASRALRDAHDTLLEQGAQEQTLSPAELAVSAQEHLLHTAAQEKSASNHEAAISALETSLIIDSLMYADDADDRETFVHRAVAEDLADELVKATHNTFGIVSVTEADSGALKIVPATHSSQQHAGLLSEASSKDLDFNDNFSVLHEVDPRYRKARKGPLSSQDYLTLAEVAERHDDPTEAAACVKRATNGNRWPKNPDTAVALLVKAEEFAAPDLKERLARFRTLRATGMDDPDSEQAATAINNAIPRLIQAGHEELAEELISSSPQEIDYSRQAIQEVFSDKTEAEHTLAVISDMHDRKRQALAVTLDAHGAPEPVVTKILDSDDPDSIAELTPEFWQEYNKMPTSDVTLGPLYAAESMHDPDERLAFMRSVNTALTELGQAETPDNAKDIEQVKQLVLTSFEDPALALQTAKAMYGESYLSEFPTLLKLFENPQGSPYSLLFIQEGTDQALGELKQCIAADQFMHFAREVAVSRDPQAAAQAVKQVSQVTQNPEIFQQLITERNPAIHAAAYTEISHKLKERGESLDTLSKPLVIELMQLHELGMGENGFEVVINDKAMEKYVDYARYGRLDPEINAAYAAYWQARRDPDVKRGPELLGPQLADMPGVQEQLTSLGLDEQVASRLFETWRTLDRYPHQILADEGVDDAAKQEAFDTAFLDQKLLINLQVRALSTFIETYSLQEATYIMETFGIHNFMRYTPEQLHKQFVDWTSGKVAAKNLVIGAHSDHNGFLRNSGSEYASLEQEGLFFFEAGSATELAKIAVAVGQREQSAKREPDLQNVIVAGHGSYYGLVLGAHGESLSIFQYIRQINNRGQVGARPNDFTRHLGNSYRIILHACSTAGEGGIAYHMRDTHERRVNASRVPVAMSTGKTGRNIIIEPEGDVYFRYTTDPESDETLPATVYDLEQFDEKS